MEGLTWYKWWFLLPIEKCVACVETSAPLIQMTNAVQMAASQLTVPPLHLPGHFHLMKQTALKNVISVQSATLPWQLHFHLITSVECCLLLQGHLVDATPLWTQSPSFRTVWMTCVSLMGMKTCFVVVWGSTRLHARTQELKSNHGGVRSAVSSINLHSSHLMYSCVFISILWHASTCISYCSTDTEPLLLYL